MLDFLLKSNPDKEIEKLTPQNCPEQMKEQKIISLSAVVSPEVSEGLFLTAK
ncbi:MAG: hypothetical protein ABR924_23850 [Terracidiphilus sp.]|jgi:hypothetical protein